MTSHLSLRFILVQNKFLTNDKSQLGLEKHPLKYDIIPSKNFETVHRHWVHERQHLRVFDISSLVFVTPPGTLLGKLAFVSSSWASYKLADPRWLEMKLVVKNQEMVWELLDNRLEVLIHNKRK